MIYLISEDNFFAMGILALLDAEKLEAHYINQDTFWNIIVDVGKEDIILLCAQSKEKSQSLAILARCTPGKTIFFIEDNKKSNTYENLRNGVISKKCDRDTLVLAINSLNNQLMISLATLSIREKTIMNMLTKQYDGARIAKLLKISVKTVSGHKHNALKKMGLEHLNARSVLLYERVFQNRF